MKTTNNLSVIVNTSNHDEASIKVFHDLCRNCDCTCYLDKDLKKANIVGDAAMVIFFIQLAAIKLDIMCRIDEVAND